MAYFPNGSSGGWFDDVCMDCLHEDPGYGCPIAYLQMEYNYKQHDNKDVKKILDYLVDQKKGCVLHEKIMALKSGPPPDKETMDIFERNSVFGQEVK